MGNITRDERGGWFIDRIVATHSLVLKTVGGDRAGEIGVNRYLGNPEISPAEILAPAVARTKAAAAGRRIVVPQDTTEVNFAGRARRRKGLGPAGDGVSPGFFAHVLIGVDADTEAVLGIAGAEIWTREPGKVDGKSARRFEDKESRRWATGAETAAAVFAGAAQKIVTGDRENDIYKCFVTRPADVELIVRAAQDRALADGTTLKSAAAAWPVLATTCVAVAAKPAGATGGPQAARTAFVELRAGRVTIRRPKGSRADRDDPESIELNLVVASEVGAPAGVEPLMWRLLSTLSVDTAVEAAEVVRLYRLRWRIEEVFRVLKKDGLDLEASQVTAASRLFSLAAAGLVASVRIMQLVDARDGSARPATDVIDAAEIARVAAIGTELEGRTKRQQNPWEEGSLAWLSWIVARLGNWNCYYRKPGPKTMSNGWRRLAERLAGFATAERLQSAVAHRQGSPLSR